MEKNTDELLLPTHDTHKLLPPPHASKQLRTRPSTFSRLLAIGFIASLYFVPRLIRGRTVDTGPTAREDICVQEDPLTPQSHSALAGSLGERYDSPEFKQRAVEWLSGAVQIPTESYDDMGAVGEDKRWEIFADFHKYLQDAFPKVHASLNLTKVNTYGLLYHWEGSDASLKPVLLAAHQDVVPVNPSTVSEWIHPPYSGHFDGEYIWGRGSGDDKSGLIGLLSTVESLLEEGFQPKRSVVLSFGFDEEISGYHGAYKLSQHLFEKYGKDSFAFLIDEGSGYSGEGGAVFALPGIAEKGYLDARVTVATPGGHSSVPPAHTSIGILALIIAHIEEHPHTPQLTRTSPIYSALQCHAAHDPTLSKKLRTDIHKSLKSHKALKSVEKAIFSGSQAGSYKALLGTTQAVDLIEGGVKTNALPERASAVINHRIAIESSGSELVAHLTKELKPLAEQFNLAFSVFGANITSPTNSAGTLVVSDAFDKTLEPAPVTPTDAAAYKLLSGTIRSAYANGRGRSTGNKMIVAPGMMTGNTDTRHYWDLTPHIFRYGHADSKDHFAGIHTINEAQKADGLVEVIRFYTTLILNADESDKI
ncbi:hypothetical protein BOTBODRAFT_54770 [Botryobasidium botryosum FD-172 SS1]|uniref:Peptidase M20 dimerisation domain-containing protein n=1 Tax=Botryobasidium botryosum (strain FD-172 SS1) TaxID=930990 RepID=A0A067MIA7_BOTB1|nr:hypothetical protein BOTBODRAFT_54770 [Botryobasidium botryosum FD-172 SS1]